jgi:uracil-DNA glycosylase
MSTNTLEFKGLAAKARACRICENDLPFGARPVFQASPESKVLIVGQAPGKKVHDSGIPFDDASGKRLRNWMGIDENQFYDDSKIAILPMGFCFPGTGKSGDNPPRPECAPAWREPLLTTLKSIQLTLVVGQYARDYHLGKSSQSLTEAVKDWGTYLPKYIPLPHPSPRNNRWLVRNPWFELEIIPVLRERIAAILKK